MDWCFKMTSWDFTQMQQDAESNISSLGGFNNLELKRKGDCSVDLKLGRIEDSFDGLLNAWSGPQVAAKVSHSGLPKRNRTISNAGKTVSCLVDGCQSDLSNCRDYHKRHKVCELHAKTPFVMVEGLQQRFCQQCSRFHLLREFDEIKRSCRRRLDGHNRRRRKVQPDPLSASSASLFHSFYPGSRFSSDPQMPTGKMQDAASLESFSARHYPSLDFGERQPLFSIYSSSHRSSSTNFPFVRSSIDASSTCQPPLTRITSSESNRALSLLSLSNPSSDINTVPVVQADIIPMVQPLNSGFKQYSHSERLLSCSSNSDLCNGNSCSQLSNCMSTNNFPPETKNQLENTSLSGGVGVVPCQVSFRVAGADTEPVYSPASHTLPIFWPS